MSGVLVKKGGFSFISMDGVSFDGWYVIHSWVVKLTCTFCFISCKRCILFNKER